MGRSARRALQALWVAVGVQLAGRLLDLRWHLTHDEFQGTAQQFEAHLALGRVGMVAGAVIAAACAARGAETAP